MLDQFNERGLCKHMRKIITQNYNMSTKQSRSVLSIKDKQIIISRFDKGQKGTNLTLEFGISKQKISESVVIEADF